MREASSRRKIALIALAAALTVGLSPAPALAQEQLRMEDAIRLALTNNERAHKAPLRVETAEGQVDRARTAFFPSLSGTGSGTWRATEDRTGRSTTTSGAVTLTQPLLNPSAFPLYAQAKHQRESERWGANQDRRVLAFDTARAFLQVLTAERVVEAAGKRLDRAKANLQNAEARAPGAARQHQRRHASEGGARDVAPRGRNGAGQRGEGAHAALVPRREAYRERAGRSRPHHAGEPRASRTPRRARCRPRSIAAPT